MVTDQSAVEQDLSTLLEGSGVDAEVEAMAASIARRLSIRRKRRDRRPRPGTGAIASVPYRYHSDDIDLDRTLEVLAERSTLDPTDIVVRERTISQRSLLLMVDVSGSMRGEKVRIAAATVAALAGEFRVNGDQFGLVAFWSDAAVIRPLTRRDATVAVLEQLLRIPARGLTNVGFGLAVGHDELLRVPAQRRTAILLTDAVHNAGPDPRAMARRFSQLNVLLETDSEHDLPMGRDLARLGHGKLCAVRTYRDVAPALNRILGD